MLSLSRTLMIRSFDVRFGRSIAYALNLSAFYREAHEQALLLYEDATEFRVDPALPYAHSMLAVSLAGLGRYGDATSRWTRQRRESKRCNDEFGLQNVFASRVRVLCRRGARARHARSSPPICRIRSER